MKMLKSLGSGARLALRSWKAILIVWFVMLLLVSLFVLPAKSIIRTGFGSSTVTELLRSGINVDVLSDLERYFASIVSYLSSGFFLFLMLGILLYSFFAGGLFKSVSNPSQILSVPCFFRASAKYFWYFLGLWFFVILMILLSGLIIIGLPVGLISQAENHTPGFLQTVAVITGLIFLGLLIIFILVADYARAWLIAAEKPALFKALGYGFSETFSHFGPSSLMMVLIMIIVLIFSWLASTIIGVWKPESGGGVFLLFIVSQLLFFVKILLKTWRYGSVTALMELNKPQSVIADR
ncbi:MAG: hypothetical protein V1903_07600 [Bacteroidota bacterium]